MAYNVVKFGGSNLKNPSGIKRILKSIVCYEKPLIVVVSAFFGVTNNLLNAIKLCCRTEFDIESFIDEIKQQKLDSVKNIVSNPFLLDEFLENLNQRLSELYKLLSMVKQNKTSELHLYDLILSYGERLSSLVLVYALKDIKYECYEAFPEDIGLITDGEFKNATVNFELSRELLNTNLSEEKTYIIPGFYGVSQNGCINLLGRGGSDYSAAAIAACLNAQSLDLWKDVKGFLSADPNIIPDAVSIQSLTYAEAAELAYFGSKILHPRTPEPLIEKQIPIRILNINDLSTNISPLTIINTKEVYAHNVIKSVSYNHNFGILKLVGSGVGIKPGILAKTTSEIDKAGINIKSVITSQTAINILLSQDDLMRAKRIVQELNIQGINSINICDDISLVAAVGEGLTSRHGIAGRLFSAVAQKGINVRIICFGASNVAMYFIVHKNDCNETIRAIHSEFFVPQECLV